jgi:hypothetical protein
MIFGRFRRLKVIQYIEYMVLKHIEYIGQLVPLLFAFAMFSKIPVAALWVRSDETHYSVAHRSWLYGGARTSERAWVTGRGDRERTNHGVKLEALSRIPMKNATSRLTEYPDSLRALTRTPKAPFGKLREALRLRRCDLSNLSRPKNADPSSSPEGMASDDNKKGWGHSSTPLVRTGCEVASFGSLSLWLFL